VGRTVLALLTASALMQAGAGLRHVAAAHAGDNLASSVEAIVAGPIKAGKIAGISVAVTQHGRTLLSRGYGLADLELNVPTPPAASYEIGSVTKQFTAAAILLLAERGQLSLDDEVTKFLPEYPTHGKRITIRHLLTHTSGIKGYTELPEFSDWSVQKRPRESLVPVFAEKPLDFEPGAALVYNNSGYFLLGLIIEKVSGSTYAEFVEKQLFTPVGMTGSYYCSERTIHRNHAHGYDTADGELVLKAYLDHTWPYSAGSLCSTADDLATWLNALHRGRVLQPASYRAMTTAAVLNDGSKTRYGFGVGVFEVGGRRVIAHGGGINGFLSEAEYYPEAELAVVVLQNTAGPAGPTEIARAIVEAVLGKGRDPGQRYEGDLSQFAGSYEGVGRGRRTTATIAASGGALTLKRAAPNAEIENLQYRGGDTFGFKDALVTFDRQAGRITGLRLDTIGGYYPLRRTGAE
jgi:CubicO group peptidase (beta-lactamase class C family)